jgi:hypothetical protein
MKKIKLLVAVFALITIATSCKKTSNTPTTSTPIILDTTKVISYKTDIAPLMSQECTSCHNNSKASAGVNLTSHANVSKFANSSLVAINSGYMPQSGKWSADKIAVFSKWITNGKLNN